MPRSIDSLNGTLGEAQRHALVRSTLIVHLASDPKVLDMIERWERRYGALNANKEYEKAKDALGSAAKELLGSDESPVDATAWKCLAAEARDRLLALGAEFNERTTKLRRTWRRGGRPLGEAIVRLVRDEMRLTPQIANDLLTYLHAAVCGGLVPIPNIYVPAPRWRLRLESAPGESCEDAISRIWTTASEAIAALQQELERAEGATRPVTTDAAVAKIRRNATWFYRIMVRGDKISDVAREYKEHRQTVQHGVRETKRLLDELPVMHWRAARRRPQK